MTPDFPALASAVREVADVFGVNHCDIPNGLRRGPSPSGVWSWRLLFCIERIQGARRLFLQLSATRPGRSGAPARLRERDYSTEIERADAGPAGRSRSSCTLHDTVRNAEISGIQVWRTDMAYPLIDTYKREKARLERAGKTKNKSAVRKAFLRLVEQYGNRRDLVLVDELPVTKQARPDATLRTVMGLDIGWVENKDRYDDLEAEVKEKFLKGYPSSNIIFENGTELIFYRNNSRMGKIKLLDSLALDQILTSFASFERPEEAELRTAIATFKSNVPDMIAHLRTAIDLEYKTNSAFKKTCAEFLIAIRAAINPSLTEADVTEMILQHILTEDIFMGVFSETEIHHENSIAKRLNSY